MCLFLGTRLLISHLMKFPSSIWRTLAFALVAAPVLFFALSQGSYVSDGQPEKVAQLPGPSPDFYPQDAARRVDPNTGDVPYERIWDAWQQMRADGRIPDAAQRGPRSSAEYSWEVINDGWPNLAITRLIYDPFDTQIWYFCTGEGWFNADGVRGLGLWKSEDGGATWNHLDSTNNGTFYWCQDMAIHPITRDLYVATRSGLQRSSDGGTTWEKVLGAGTAAGRNSICDIEFAADGTVFASIGIFEEDGLYRSSTGDEGSWEKLTNGIPGSGVHRIEFATAPSDADVLYAIPTENSSDRHIQGIYKTEDGGDSWFQVALPGGEKSKLARSQGWYDLTIKVDPNNPDVVVAGGLDIWRSRDGGDSWQQLTAGRPGDLLTRYMHVDQHEIVFHGSDTVYFGNDGGIFKCDNFTDDNPIIYNRNLGYNVTQFYAVDQSPIPGDQLVIGGTQDNGSKMSLTDGLSEFKDLSGADGSFCNINHQDPSIFYTSKQYDPVYRFTNGGFELPDTLNNDDLDNSNLRFINAIEMDATDPDIVYQASNRGVQRLEMASSDSARWVKASKNTGTISALGVTDERPHTVYVGRISSSGSVFRLDSAHVSDDLTDLVDLDPNNELPSVSFFQTLTTTCVAVDPSDAAHVVVTYGNFGVRSVFETRNALDPAPSWQEIEGDLPDIPVNWALVHPNNPDVIYLATDMGIFYTNQVNGTSTEWLPCTKFPFTRTDMLRVREADLRVVVGTHGRGIWQGTLDASGTGDNDIEWEERGPINVGGRTRTIVVDPNDPTGETVWAGSVSGGLWKTRTINALSAEAPVANLIDWDVFPNPFRSQISIRISLDRAAEGELRIFDLQGREVAHLGQFRAPDGQINTSWTPSTGLQQGVYLLSWQDSNGNQQVRRLVFSPQG